jgi:ferritin
MLSKKMQDALNEQINAELYSAYIYLSMSAYFEDANLSGFANWMRAQYQEEVAHAMRFYNYVHDRGGRVLLKEIAAPQTEWKSPVDVYEHTLEHERHVSALIHKLVDLANEENDHATHQMLQWFVEEQVEEEATAEQVLEELRLIGDNKGGLFMMNREMAQRQFAADAEE